MDRIESIFAEAFGHWTISLTSRRLYLEDEGVLNTLTISSRFEVVGVDSTGNTLYLLLRLVFWVVNRNSCKIRAIAFDFNALSYHEIIFFSGSLFNQFAIIHVSLERVGFNHFQAGVIVILPSHSFFNVPEVFYELWDRNLAKLCLKSHIAIRVAYTAVHTIDLDPFSRLFIELPICSIE